MKDYKYKYIGEKKIVSCCISENKTYLGNRKVEICFEDESISEYPEDMLEYSVSDEPIDLTKLSDSRINPIVVKLLAIMTEAELTKDEVDRIIGSRLSSTLNYTLNEAIDKLFGKKVYNVTLKDIDDILKK